MQEKKLFNAATGGIHDLYNTYSGHSVLYFNRLLVGQAPEEQLFVSISQFRDGLTKELDRLPLSEFKEQYVDGDKVLHFDPMSRVFLALSTGQGAISAFEFELHYELAMREHEPVYL